MRLAFLACLLMTMPAMRAPAQIATDFLDLGALCRFSDGATRTINSLWGENPRSRQLGEGRTTVVIANIKGPGIITMIHFALPQTLKLDRSTVIRMFWDGEKSPSVEVPLTDFFCDPNGALECVDSLLINKKRGWNCYLPMPFAHSARIELSADGRRYPSGSWSQNPCYAYVTWRPLKSVPLGTGYFHAHWRQETLLLGKRKYVALTAQGRGQFVGWNMTIRGVGRPNAGYPVDENVQFYVDGETAPSVEWQGLEDSFGFSWGFPEQGNNFAFTGYQPWYNGAAAYRFTLTDRIPFRKSLRVAVGFGKSETFFLTEFSKPGNELQLSSVVYWYQKEPHLPFDAMPPATQRRPSLLASGRMPPTDPAVAVSLTCGCSAGDDEYIRDGWDFRLIQGFSFEGAPWTSDVKYCWADSRNLLFDIVCPKGTFGKLRLYLLDGDNYCGGRRQVVAVAGRVVGVFEGFQQGRWVDVPISATDTATGCIHVAITNQKPGANAVVSKVVFVESAQ